MKLITWEVIPQKLPAVTHWCKKCGKKTPFICSERFRVNAQQKNLDIWLIYKCEKCDTTWNAEVYARIPPQKLDNTLLERFHCNDRELAARYALDMGFLQKNLVQPEEFPYSVEGPVFDPKENTELTIRCAFPLPIRVSRVIRGKLEISQKEFLSWIEAGQIRSIPPKDLKKCRLGDGILLVFENRNFRSS